MVQTWALSISFRWRTDNPIPPIDCGEDRAVGRFPRPTSVCSGRDSPVSSLVCPPTGCPETLRVRPRPQVSSQPLPSSRARAGGSDQTVVGRSGSGAGVTAESADVVIEVPPTHRITQPRLESTRPPSTSSGPDGT